jgi:GNAT superfamily N-acetyltransferase
MPTPVTLRYIDTCWANQLGCRVEHLQKPGLHVTAHGPGLSDYEGVMALRRGPACIVSVPRALMAEVFPRLSHFAPETAFDRNVLGALLGDRVAAVIGPAYQGYADITDFRPADPLTARQLTYIHVPALHRLESACKPEEWAASGIDPQRLPLFGCFTYGSELASAAMLEERVQGIYFVGVITHPDYRGGGYGSAVVSFATDYGLATGGILHYQTLEANSHAVAIARKLGYQQYASTLAVRLK